MSRDPLSVCKTHKPDLLALVLKLNHLGYRIRMLCQHPVYLFAFKFRGGPTIANDISVQSLWTNKTLPEWFRINLNLLIVAFFSFLCCSIMWVTLSGCPSQMSTCKTWYTTAWLSITAMQFCPSFFKNYCPNFLVHWSTECWLSAVLVYWDKIINYYWSLQTIDKKPYMVNTILVRLLGHKQLVYPWWFISQGNQACQKITVS